MKKMSVEEIKDAISALTENEYTRLLNEINQFDNLTSKIKVSKCVYCQSENIIKHGRYKHLDRHRCKDCGKTFIPTTGSIFYYIHKKHKYLEYFKIITTEGIIPISKIKKRLDIANQTAFDWRHKFLMLYSSGFKPLDSEVLLKQIQFRFSQKGRKNISPQFTVKASLLPANVLVAENSNLMQTRLYKLGELEKQDLNKLIKKLINKKSKVIVSENPTLSTYLISKKYKIVDVQNKKIVELGNFKKLYNSSLDTDFKRTISTRMRGVATKYLQVYSNFLAGFSFNLKFFDYRIFFKNRAVWFKFIQVERMYVNFIKSYSGIYEPFDPIKRLWKSEDKFHHLDYGVLIGISKIYSKN